MQVAARVSVQIKRAGIRQGVVALISADADRVAGFIIRPDRQDGAIAGERYPAAELIASVGIGGLDIGPLRPRTARRCEGIYGAASRGTVIVLIPAYAGGATALAGCADDEQVAIAAQGDTPAK